MEQDWERVDAYIADRLIPPDEGLDAALAANAAAGLPEIDVSPAQGKLLHILARTVGARRILEIGTLGGYSTIWLARALPDDGRLVTLEYEFAHAAVARANIARAGLAARVDIRVGAALDTLPGVAPLAPFDFVFIDADKVNNADYLDWALRLTRPGGVIVCDNVVRAGRVADSSSADPAILGSRRFFDRLAAEPRLTATAIQTVGAKGWDGFAMALVT
jgi:predicted O-methyltransferase YrrM